MAVLPVYGIILGSNITQAPCYQLESLAIPVKSQGTVALMILVPEGLTRAEFCVTNSSDEEVALKITNYKDPLFDAAATRKGNESSI